MKLYTEFNLVTWLRLVKFTELNIYLFWFLNFNYRSCHWEIYKIIRISQFSICERAKLNSHENFLPVVEYYRYLGYYTADHQAWAAEEVTGGQVVVDLHWTVLLTDNQSSSIHSHWALGVVEEPPTLLCLKIRKFINDTSKTDFCGTFFYIYQTHCMQRIIRQLKKKLQHVEELENTNTCHYKRIE